jgi:hypothetical protein
MATRRGLVLAGLLVLVCVGCDLGTLAWLILPENKEQPDIRRLASDDRKKDVKVLILAYSGIDLRQNELTGADTELCRALSRQLAQQCEANQERVAIIPPNKVEDYKSTHPNWKHEEPSAIGRRFGVDYVIVLELHTMSLYEPGMAHMLYRGRVNLTVTLFDVKHPDEGTEQRDANFQYPSEANAMTADADLPPQQFRSQFLTFVAKRLAWYFTPHSKREGYYVE